MPDYATLLRDHVTLKVRSIDRIFLAGLRPSASIGGTGLHVSPLAARGFHIPSSAAFGRIGEHDVRDIQCFAESHRVPLVQFKKGARVRPLLQQAAKDGGDGRVMPIGMACAGRQHVAAGVAERLCALRLRFGVSGDGGALHQTPTNSTAASEKAPFK